MPGLTAAPAHTAARLRFRACSRHVAQQPASLPAHRARLIAALDLPGAEPAQGALADLFLGCADAAAQRAALDLVRERLHPQIAAWFEAWLDRSEFPRCSRLATRWSVLATASLDVPRRALRCTSDDARALAAAAVQAWRRADAAAQQEFLEHCRVCRDTLAFTVARRAIQREALDLPADWAEAYRRLQTSVLTS
ncbi:MAG: hypothetical protein KGN16_22490 [Burkholderiales bacterium]|nr:hypothetical protein [Burkholderiales bacterium]